MTAMDEQVLRGMARWPNVPAVFGWLALDRRGNWLLQGEPVTNPVVTAYIGRNYERDAEGRWFFQNGPQRVYLDLEYTPYVFRAVNAPDQPLALASHTGADVTALHGAWIDETGALLVETEHGVGLIYDRDLDIALPALVDEDGETLREDVLEEAMTCLQQGKHAAVWMRLAASNVQVEPIRADSVPAHFGYLQHPGEDAQAATNAAS
jgi:hypothetical protein